MKQFTLDFLRTLFPEPLDDTAHGGHLVVFSLAAQGKPRPQSQWARSVEEAATVAARLVGTRHVFYGVALQNPDKALELARRKKPKATKRSARGYIESAMALPGLWADLDVAAGNAHRGDKLPPDRDAALGLLRSIPHPPSIVVRSGYGYHVYWLFKELWILDTPEERAEATSLLERLQGALRREARIHGWEVDPTADLARVMRLPGTFNHKLGEKKPVVAEIRGDRRYDPLDFDMLPAPEGRPRPAAGSSKNGGAKPGNDQPFLHKILDGGPPADFRRVIHGCRWMRHCYDDRKNLGEHEWFAALSIIGRCRTPELDGRQIAHQMSHGYDGYSEEETDDKLDHALRDGGPRSCKKIYKLGDAATYCDPCPHKVTSPIILGRPWYKGPEDSAKRTASGGAGSRRPGSAADDGRQPVLISTREHEVNGQALEILAEREPNLFERGGTLVEVLIPRSEDSRAPAARVVPEARLQEILAQHCDFQATRTAPGRKAFQQSVHPPRWCVRGLLGRGIWPELPLLTGLVEGPVLRPDGSVLQEPGYDAASGLYYAAQGARFERVSNAPNARQVRRALAQIDEMVCDFPFQTPEHHAAWLSALLTPLARFAFRGPSPLNLIDANVRGAGKSLLADVVASVLGGRPAERMSYTRDDDELRKSITSLAIEGTRLALIDNVSGSFGSPTLDRALTATFWRDRLLGSNTQVSLPLRVVWFATGNNVRLEGDTPRRCLHIRLESEEERPELRTGFRHPRLLSWIADQRYRLLPAALTLLRGYVAAGRPDMGLEAWGSYEDWSDLVRSTVVWLGLPDPGGTRGGLDDADNGPLKSLVAGLSELLDGLGRPATASEILRELVEKPAIYGDLRSALEEIFPHVRTGELPAPAKLAYKLRSMRGRVVDGHMLQVGPRTRGGVQWLVRPVSE